MSKLLALQKSLRLAGFRELRKAVVWMFVRVCRKGKQCLELRNRIDPQTHPGSVPLSPRIRSETYLNVVEQRKIDDSHEQAVPRINPVDDVRELSYRARGRYWSGSQFTLEPAQLFRCELAIFNLLEYLRENKQPIFVCPNRGNRRIGSLAQPGIDRRVGHQYDDKRNISSVHRPNHRRGNLQERKA